ncbi:hypothetical protein ACFYTF_30130 [Nocardia thailandica]|uniref:Uncharacterized protein n=1 Tax=Nocardia thailandica TaxID=257275 RepID=A0ABW6PXD2_9NOCA
MLTVPGILSGITVLLPIGAGPDEPPGDVVAPVHEALFTTRATRDHRAAVTGTDTAPVGPVARIDVLARLLPTAEGPTVTTA